MAAFPVIGPGRDEQSMANVLTRIANATFDLLAANTRAAAVTTDPTTGQPHTVSELATAWAAGGTPSDAQTQHATDYLFIAGNLAALLSGNLGAVQPGLFASLAKYHNI